MLTAAGCSGGDGGTPRAAATSPAIAALSGAIREASSARASLLASVDAVQQGAAALDATDAACVTGEGVAARKVLRAGEPATARARTAARGMPRQLTTYTTSLDRLGTASSAVSGAPRKALLLVVSNGRLEATALGTFTTAALAAWKHYEVLATDTATWVTRAVTPWYRDAQEGAAAYAILVGDTRPALERARDALGTAATDVRPPVTAQAQTLREADAALAGLRGSS